MKANARLGSASDPSFSEYNLTIDQCRDQGLDARDWQAACFISGLGVGTCLRLKSLRNGKSNDLGSRKLSGTSRTAGEHRDCIVM